MMYIRDPKALAGALQPILEDRVLVRFSVRGRHAVRYHAELVVQATVGGEDFLYRARISVRVVQGSTEVESEFRVVGLRHVPDILELTAREWHGRVADDWCHGEQFMGAYEIFRDGQLYTSVKLESYDSRWHLLIGVILGVLSIKQKETDPANVVEVHCIELMRNRFYGFAGETVSAWADQTFSAH